MTDENPEDLHDEVYTLRQRIALGDEIDELIENAMRAQAPMAETMPRALETLCDALGAVGVLLRTLDETGNEHDWNHPRHVDFPRKRIDDVCNWVEDAGTFHQEYESGEIYAQRLDLSNSYLGTVIAQFERRHTDREREQAGHLLRDWAEHVDNYVASIAEARMKQRALSQISDALKRPILEQAIDEALVVLKRYVPYDDLILVCQSEEVLDRSAVCYRVIVDRESIYESKTELDPRVGALVNEGVARLLDPHVEEDVIRELRVDATHLDDVAIMGLDEQTVVGRIVVGTNLEPIKPFAADVLDRFADYLRQRVVDFSREWKHLSRRFSKPVVDRLLRQEGYVETYLTPREREVAVMFADVSGFTRLSEEVLESPELIARFMDRWSHHVVELIRESGGVFDKMVGDCIIGLWGPPFFEEEPAGVCGAALDAARRIRDYTRALGESADFPEVRAAGRPTGVAVGLNFCPLYVGLIGPSEDYTGFSSGMNNTARLQGLAGRDEILAMDSFVAALEEGGAAPGFGDVQSAEVKNVGEPLRYRVLPA